MKHRICDILKNNKVFGVILLFQLVLVTYFFMALFFKRNILEIRLDNMYFQDSEMEEDVWKEEAGFWGIESLTDDIREMILFSEDYAIADGAYKITVEYSSQKSMDAPSAIA